MNAIVEQMKSEIESLTKERDKFKAAYYSAEKCASDLSKGCAKLQTERDALTAAAKLAWVAIVELRYSNSTDKSRSVSEFAVQALREAGVQ